MGNIDHSEDAKTLRARSFTVAQHITGEKRPVVFLDAAEAEVESLRQQLEGAVAEAEKWKRIAQDRCTCVVTCGDRPEDEGGICKDLPRARGQ
jgi:hypothetical protein